MDDEIDIEEHDVLDNPIVRSIFPDITALKKEITYYYEDELNGDPESRPLQLVETEDQLENGIQSETCEFIIDVDNYYPQNQENQPKHRNKIILGSKPTSTYTSLSSNVSEKIILGSKSDLDGHGKLSMGIKPRHQTQHEISAKVLEAKPIVVEAQDDIKKQHIISKGNVVTQNDRVILLGSNPKDSQDDEQTGTNNKTQKKSTTKHIKILLIDIKSYLNKNSRYCKKCCRLFLRKNALEIHESKMHPKKAEKKIYPPKKVDCKDRHKCFCGSSFSTRYNLYRHYKNKHADKIKASTKSRTHSSNSCAICNISFKTLIGLKVHNSSKHQAKSAKQKGRNSVRNTYSKENDNTTKVNISLPPNKRRKLDHKKESIIGSTSEKIQDKSTPTAKRKKPERDSANKTTELTSISEITASKRKEIAKAKHLTKTDNVVLKNNGDTTTDTNINKSPKKNVSKYITRANSNYTASNLCLHCNKQFPDQKSLTEHMYEIMEPKRCSSVTTEKSDTKTQDDKILFACRHCSYYLLGITNYFTHIIKNHKIEKFLQINKEKFDPQCKFCSFKCSSISTHNNHIYRNHINLMYMKIEDEIEHDKNKQLRKSSDHFYEDAFSEYKDFALESVLFECNKCSTCFLSSDIAMDHEQHKELLINWKCTICSLIMKEQDKVMHLKQHSFSELTKVVTLNETANVIYTCTKCAIHFTENRYQKHYPICGLEISDSFRCSKCDILVDKAEKIDHESQHGKLGNNLDFTIIDCNVIIIDKDASLKSICTNFEPGHIKRTVEHNCLTYCPTCKVFLKDLGLKNKNHIKGTCPQVLKYICDECGLVFTSSVLTLHKEHHEKEKSLRLQDFKFFDLQGKQVRPPIPEYPHCTKCGVHFLKKNASTSHICDETDFLTCDICNIKLTEKAYILHMSFHFYVIQTSRPELENLSDTPKEYMTTDTQEVNKHELEYSELKLGKGSSKTNSLKGQIKESLPKNKEPCTEKTTDEEDSLVVLYTCKPCSISFESYDEVIKHCQTHYSKEYKKITCVKQCKQCLLNFDNRYYICHEQRVHLGVSKIQILKFDPRYYTTKNRAWIQHIFEPLTEEVVAKLLEKSIYRHEHRIKLECIQRGSSNIYVYKCDKCKHFIDQGGVYKHAQNPCGSSRKHPCSYCGINYRSWLSRGNHEELHKQNKSLTKRSLNIILFNQKKDTLFNGRVFSTRNQNIFYQCRNCSGVTEKSIPANHKCDTDTLIKCKTCGLLICNMDIKTHMAKHSHTKNFCAENFKVILFGKSNAKDPTKKISSSFIGTVYDYSVFKCKKCEMCLRNTEYAENHVCSNTYDLDRLLCRDCNLYFPSSYYKLHEKRHQTDPDFIKENINVVEFIDGKVEEKSVEDQIVRKENHNILTVDNDDDDEDGALMSFKDKVDENPIDDKTLYKCKCGLHFVNKEKVAEHVKTCQKKHYKQNCSKCNLLFNASELFSHLIAHHKDKSQVCNFKVIELTEFGSS